MGLFDFIKKKTDTLSPEEQARREEEQRRRNEWAETVTLDECVATVGSSRLLDVAMSTTQIDFDESSRLCTVTREVPWERRWRQAAIPADKCPKCMENAMARGEDLLKLLAARGDCPIAGFYLGVFYEIGFFQAGDNAAEADKYYKLALSQDCSLVKKFIMPERSINPDNGVLTTEERLLVVFSLDLIKASPNGKAAYDALALSERSSLRYVYTVGLAYLASIGHRYAVMALSSGLMGKSPFSFDEELFLMRKKKDCGEMMAKKMIETARGGDQLAARVLRAFGLDHRQNYN